MQSKLLVGCITALLMFFALPAPAQSVYSAHEDRPRFSVGGGFSVFSPDWGPNRHVMGTTLFADYRPPLLPDFLSGLSLELEARDLSWNRGTYPANNPHVGGRPGLPRYDTLGGGLLYHAERLKFHRLVPYAKGIVSYGSLDFTLPRYPHYSHDTRTVTALGGGVDYRLSRRLTLRGDYQYQWWPQMFGPNALNPNGFTVGALYNFGH